MQGKVNPLIAAAVGVVIVALAIFFYVRSGTPPATGGGFPTSAAYTHPSNTNHP